MLLGQLKLLPMLASEPLDLIGSIRFIGRASSARIAARWPLAAHQSRKASLSAAACAAPFNSVIVLFLGEFIGGNEICISKKLVINT